MALANKLLNFLNQAVNDNGITPSHICLFLALYRCYNEAGTNPFNISRKQVMYYSKLSSAATYHKCIVELNNRGYLFYEPSFHPRLGSRVQLL